ncbi:MAG: Hsp20 family protein [Ignavibacteriales bacterium]|nr:Hsp20 family protein [Ignavibacteriales bacterium]
MQEQNVNTRVEEQDNVRVENREPKWEETFAREGWLLPATDLYERENDFMLEVNLPGVAKDRVRVRVENGYLVVMGKADVEETTNRKYLMKETRRAHFYRRFKLSDTVDASRIDAKHELGQLRVSLPKREETKPRTIEVK